jgi:hypothetical protein
MPAKLQLKLGDQRVAIYCDMTPESRNMTSDRQRFAKHIPVAKLNRPLLDNGYADYNRRTVEVCVMFAVCTGLQKDT